MIDITKVVNRILDFLLLENINIILNYKLLQHRGVPKTKKAINIDRFFFIQVSLIFSQQLQNQRLQFHPYFSLFYHR